MEAFSITSIKLENRPLRIEEIAVEKYKCNGCGYVYNPEKGEGSWEHYIPPRTPFDKLIDSWVCPVCGAPKDMFEKAASPFRE